MDNNNNNNWVNPSTVGNKLPNDFNSKIDTSNDLLSKITAIAEETKKELESIRIGLDEIKGIINKDKEVTIEQPSIANNEQPVIEPVAPVENIAPVVPEVAPVVEPIPAPSITENVPTVDNNLDSNLLSMDDLLQSEIQMPEVPNISEPELNLPPVENIVPAMPEVTPVAPVENIAPAMPEVTPAAPVQNVAPAMPEVAPVAPVDNIAPAMPEVAPVAPVQNVAPAMPEVASVAPVQNVAPAATPDNGVEEIKDFYPTEAISEDSLQRSFITPEGFNDRFLGNSNANIKTLEKVA